MMYVSQKIQLLKKQHLHRFSNCFIFDVYLPFYVSYVFLSIPSFSSFSKHFGYNNSTLLSIEKSQTHCISIELQCKKGVMFVCDDYRIILFFGVLYICVKGCSAKKKKTFIWFDLLL